MGIRSNMASGPWPRRAYLHVAGALLAVFVSLLFASASWAFKADRHPGWELTSRAYPTNLPPGGEGMVEVELFNVGAGSSTGEVTLTDTLPTGLTATKAGPLETFGEIFEESTEYDEQFIEEDENNKAEVPIGFEDRVWSCTGTTVVTCKTRPGYNGVLRPIVPGSDLRLGIYVKVDPGASGAVTNKAEVSGGGAAGPAAVSAPLTISSTESGFGFAQADAWFSQEDGTVDAQAGSHPFEATFSFDMNAGERNPSGGTVRNMSVSLPPGLVGDTNAVPQCTRAQFLSALFGGCPATTQIGVDRAITEPFPGAAPFRVIVPVYNLVPPPGVPVEFGFTALGTNILLDSEVRSGSDYGINENIHNIGFKPVGNVLTVWGSPNEKVHDSQRCGFVPGEFVEGSGGQRCGLSSNGAELKPFLTLPTSCEGPLTTTMRADTWENSETAEISYESHDQTGTPSGYTGCQHLSFSPSLSVSPDTTFADTPAGLSVDLKVPQDGLLDPEGLATANIRDTTVTLPEGVVVNPGQAAGLGACQEGETGLGTNGPASCPNSSKVGTVDIATPVLRDHLTGNVYVLQSNPPNLKLLLDAQADGVFLKLVGDVHLNENTGQLVTTFSHTPELPFTDFKLAFSGGAQAALSTPVSCGTYSTTSDFTSWATPLVQDVFPSSSFVIDHGTSGTACPPSPLPFGPSMIAGSTTDQAGGFTDFSLLLTRPDDQQRISGLRFKTPEGLLGMISGVPLCGEAQANAGTCSSASQIGHTVVEAGPGPYPLVVPQPGQPPAPIYLTAGYKGAPYGLSIVVPLHVGPFVLPTQIVRARIEVDPRTTELTVTTDALPQIIAGVPADLRAINAVIDRPGFMFNPTGCESQAFSGTATGTEGAAVPISTHFQMGSCRSLTFKPNFKVSTNAKTSRKQGASLDATIVYPKGPFPDNQASIQSNVKAVKVALPKQLPSRLTTLQKACPAKTFETNPVACPSGSIVGSATAETPVLPVKLTGPAYFVSYGGAKFPELVIVLQGYGVTVDLHGETFISEKTNITTSTFRQVPDVPITRFELKLPQGPNSALAAVGNLCSKPLKMPTVFTGQNGAQLKQSTPITVNGCPKHKNKPRRKRKK